MSIYDSELFAAMLAKHCNSLQSEDKKKRKRALEELSKQIVCMESDNQAETMANVYKHILKCLNDRVESCREQAVFIIMDIVKLAPIDDYQYLTYLIPVLVQRLGSQEITEPSEEVRMALISLVHLLIHKFPTQLPHHMNDLIQILLRTLLDPYPKIKKESCECASDLAKSIPTHFYTQSELVIKPILQNFTHQHSKVRTAAINAMGNVLCYGNSKSMENVVIPLAERLFDQAPVVRQAVTQVIGMWLLKLPDRYSYFHRLLPIILTSLSDTIPELRQEALKFWEEVGKQYMEENENDLKEQMDFIMQDPPHYPVGVIRPNLGCRTLVRRHLSQIVPALVAELSDWLVDIRIKSSQLLCVVVLNAEAHITHHLEKLLVGLYRASSDEDARVVENAERAAELIGYFVPPDTYCKLILPTVEDMPSAGHLRILGGVLQGSERCSLESKLLEIGEFLCRHEICESKETTYQLQLLSCCTALITVCKEDCQDISEQLFRVLISVLSLTVEDCVLTKTKDLLEKLTILCGHKSVLELYQKHIPTILQELQATAETWSFCSPQRFIFETLLINSGQVIGLHLDVVALILVTISKPESDPEMKLKMFTILSALLMNNTETVTLAADADTFLITVIQDVIMPNLVWHAGRTAEAIRTAAVSCLCVVLHNPPTSVNTDKTLNGIINDLLPLLLGLVEDSSRRTRLFALRSLCCLITLLRNHMALSADHIHQVYPVVMKRLDDVNDDVRVAAIKSLLVLFKSLPEDYNITCSETHLEALYSTMLIHLDDPDTNFQKVMLDALKEIGCISPELLWKKVECTKQNFRNVNGCTELLTYLKNTVGC